MPDTTTLTISKLGIKKLNLSIYYFEVMESSSKLDKKMKQKDQDGLNSQQMHNTC